MIAVILFYNEKTIAELVKDKVYHVKVVVNLLFTVPARYVPD